MNEHSTFQSGLRESGLYSDEGLESQGSPQDRRTIKRRAHDTFIRASALDILTILDDTASSNYSKPASTVNY